MKRYSIIHPLQNCYICYNSNVELHECFFGTKHRNKSIKYGLVVALCNEHHRGTYGVHGKHGHDLDIRLKRTAQEVFNNDEEFMQIFGRNYL